MALVVTVTPNAALDRTLHVDELRPATRHVARASYAQPGGKGINVSRVLARLGVAVRSVVVVGGETGRRIVRTLAEEGLDPIAVEAGGESRTCIELIDGSGRRPTQVHEPGVCADGDTAERLLEAVRLAIPGASWLAVCGSLARGLPGEITARLVACARERGVRAAVDQSGAGLVRGWAAHPDLLRVNRDEAAQALAASGCASRSLPPARAPGSPGLSVVSDGPRAVIAWSREGAVYRVAPAGVEERNPIGAGDAMMAGLLATLGERDPAEALRFATALACAEVESPVASRPDLERARALAPLVSLEAAP